MKYPKATHILTVIIAIVAGSATGYAEDFAAKADSAYLSSNYLQATELYEKEIKTNGTSAALYYNLGNSYYRIGKHAKAIVAYERALRLDPSDSDARANLEFVNSKLIDKKGYEGSFLSRAFTDISNLMSTNAWAWMALIFFIGTIAAVAMYFFGSQVLLRKIGFFGGGATLLLSIVSLIFAFHANALKHADNVAIVKVPSSILSTAPRAPKDRNEEAMLLHEGARLTILDSITSPTDSLKTKWYDVSFDNEHRAWINAGDVEII